VEDQDRSLPKDAIDKVARTRDEAVQISRLFHESKHGQRLSYQALKHGAYEPLFNHPDRLDAIPEMEIAQANDCCNKTVPVYVLPETRKSRGAAYGVLLHALYNWLYEDWRVPYCNDIEWGQFIAKMFQLTSFSPAFTTGAGPKHDIDPISLIEVVARLNAVICDRVKLACREVMQYDGQPADDYIMGLVDEPLAELQRDQQFFILQPLFRALLVIVHEDDYDADGDISKMIVSLVRTGVEDGLSAPISFDSIETIDMVELVATSPNSGVQAVRTTLKVAIAFVKDMEQREVKVFGPRPDPVEACKGGRAGYLWSPDPSMRVAHMYGWRSDWEPLEYPSSRWVDTTKQVPVHDWDLHMNRIPIFERVLRSIRLKSMRDEMEEEADARKDER
jgi:hypothetical protein